MYNSTRTNIALLEQEFLQISVKSQNWIYKNVFLLLNQPKFCLGH